MGNSILYLSLISAAGMTLVAVAAVTVWRQKTKFSYRWFFLGDVLCAPVAPMKLVCWCVLVGIPILRWCEAQFDGTNTEQFLDPQAVIAS